MNRSEKLESHIVIITTFYPNAVLPQRAVFLKQLVEALTDYCSITVVAPIPYAPGFLKNSRWGKLRSLPAQETSHGVIIYHPRFIAVPGMEVLSGISYFLGTLKRIRQLSAQHKKIILNGHRIYPDGTGVALLARALRLPYVLTAHGSDINRTFTRTGRTSQMKAAMRRADALISVSKALTKKIADKVPREIHHIPCAGFNPALFKPDATGKHRQETGRVILYIGALLELKGTGLLVDAWHILQSTGSVTEKDKLFLVGGGNYRHTLESKIAQYGLADSVTLVGNIDHKDIPLWLNRSNLLCLPSYMEGTPNVIIEALSCGVPVCATSVGGIPEVIQNDVNGVLIDNLSADTIAVALAKCLQKRWDQTALIESVKQYTWANLAKSYYSVFNEIERKRLP